MHRLFTHLIFLVSLSSLITVEIFSQESKLAKEPKTQEQRIINTIPSKVPLKVEIINGGMESALEDIQIKITNIGKKPIYYFDISLATAKEFAPQHRVGLISYQFGNPKLGNFSRPFHSLETERSERPPLEAGDSTVFGNIDKNLVEAFWKLMEEKGYSVQSKISLEIGLLRFGDGTGYMTRQAVEMPDAKSSSSDIVKRTPVSFFLRQ